MYSRTSVRWDGVAVPEPHRAPTAMTRRVQRAAATGNSLGPLPWRKTRARASATKLAIQAMRVSANRQNVCIRNQTSSWAPLNHDWCMCRENRPRARIRRIQVTFRRKWSRGSGVIAALRPSACQARRSVIAQQCIAICRCHACEALPGVVARQGGWQE